MAAAAIAEAAVMRPTTAALRAAAAAAKFAAAERPAQVGRDPTQATLQRQAPALRTRLTQQLPTPARHAQQLRMAAVVVESMAAEESTVAADTNNRSAAVSAGRECNKRRSKPAPPLCVLCGDSGCDCP